MFFQIQFCFVFQSSHQACPPNTRAFAENLSSPETYIGTNTRTYQSHDDAEEVESVANAPDGSQSDVSRSTKEPIAGTAAAAGTSPKQATHSENEERKLWNHSMKPSSTYLQLASRPRQKYVSMSLYCIYFVLTFILKFVLFAYTLKGKSVQRDASCSQSD